YLVREPRDVEVKELNAPVSSHEHVLGLQVTVDDPLLVLCRESVRELNRVVDRLARGQAVARELGSKRLALQELADDVRRPVVRTNVEDRRDVRMVQESGGAGLLLEAAESIRVVRKRRR